MKPQKITTGPLTVKSALIIVGLALTAGLAFDRLVRYDPPGLGFVMFSTLVIVSATIVRRPGRWETYLLLAGSWTLALWVMIRAADYLAAINICAGLLLLSAAVTSEVFAPRVWLLRVRDLPVAGLGQLRSVCVGAFAPLAAVARERTNIRIGPALPYLRGFLFAAPVFVVFAALLASADSVFSNFLGDVIPSFDISIGETGAHVIWTAVVAWLTAGFLVFIAQPEPQPQVRPGDLQAAGDIAGDRPYEAPAFDRPIKRVERGPAGDRYVESMTVLGSITALFALFVGFQFAYLFSGAAQVDLPGVTYAQYARAGFFQLLAVATLTSGLVWVAFQISGARLEGRRLTAFRAVSALMILLTGVILASALKRLGLYEQAYGFTRLRLLSHVFSLLVGGVLLLLAAQLFWRERQLFLAGTVALGFTALTALNAINPDAYIAARNLDRRQPRKAPSLGYISELSADAVPAVIARYRNGPPNVRYADQIDAWACETLTPDRGWRGWNLGAARAQSARDRSGLNRASPRRKNWMQFCVT